MEVSKNGQLSAFNGKSRASLYKWSLLVGKFDELIEGFSSKPCLMNFPARNLYLIADLPLIAMENPLLCFNYIRYILSTLEKLDEIGVIFTDIDQLSDSKLGPHPVLGVRAPLRKWVIPCYTMLYHVIPCYTMLYHVIPCYTMLYHVMPPLIYTEYPHSYGGFRTKWVPQTIGFPIDKQCWMILGYPHGRKPPYISGQKIRTSLSSLTGIMV